MDAAQFRERVSDARRTELDRLGSGKLLVALTGADLRDEAVLAVAADAEYAARETFAAWADDEADPDAATAFATLAERTEDHYDRIRARVDGHEPDPVPLYEYLLDLSGTVERAAGLVGRGLVADRTHLQLVGYFVNEADEGTADLFRVLRADAEDATETGLDLLADRSDDEWERAVDAATGAVDVAYGAYADALADLGMDPKPVC